MLEACICQQSQRVGLEQQCADGAFLIQTLLELRKTFLKLALLGTRPSAQDQRHGKVMHKIVLFAEFDCRVSVGCDDGGVTPKLMHTEVYSSRHRLAERMLGCFSTTAGLSTDPQRLIRIAEHR